MWRQRNLKFAGGIYLLHCMFCCGGSCSAIEIKKSFLNQLISRKIKSFIRKTKNQKTTENLAKKSLSRRLCIPANCRQLHSDCVTLTQGICPICWGSATPWRCFKMRTPDRWNWLNTPKEALGAVRVVQQWGIFTCHHTALRAAVSFVLLLSLGFNCYKKKLLNLILFMKWGAGLPANQWFQWCFYFI